MEVLEIEKTHVTPYVKFNGDAGILKIIGKSVPEDAEEFYLKIIKYLKKYLENPQKTLDVTLAFEYFNTSSSKMILYLLKEMKEIDANITWYYEEDDEDIEEAGWDYEALIRNHRFDVKETKDIESLID